MPSQLKGPTFFSEQGPAESKSGTAVMHVMHVDDVVIIEA